MDIDKFLSTFTPRAVVLPVDADGASVHLGLVLSAVSSKSPFWGFVGIREREPGRHTFLVRPTWRGANDVQRGRETRFVRQEKKQRRGGQKFSRHDSHFGHTTFLALIGAATNCELLRVPPKRCPMSRYKTIPKGFVSGPGRVSSWNHSTSHRDIMG